MNMTETLLTPEGEQRHIDLARAWLEKCRRTVGYERTLRESARAQYDMLKGIDYSAVNVQGSPSPDAVPNAVIAHEGIAEKLEAIADDAAKRIADAAAALARMEDPTEARCLHLYYIDAVDTWERVCVKMSYSYDGMMKLSRRALLHAYDLMPHTERDPNYRAD